MTIPVPFSHPSSPTTIPPTKTLPITYPFCSPWMVRPSIGCHQSLLYPLGQGRGPPLCVLAQGELLYMDWAPKVHTYAGINTGLLQEVPQISEVSSQKPMFLGSGSIRHQILKHENLFCFPGYLWMPVTNIFMSWTLYLFCVESHLGDN